VLDVQMPGASGIDVYDVVRAIPSSPRSRSCSSPPIPERRGRRCLGGRRVRSSGSRSTSMSCWGRSASCWGTRSAP